MKTQNVFKTLLLSIILTSGLNFASKVYAASEGGSNGGGGNGSSRETVSKNEIYDIIAITHKLAPYNFKYLVNAYSTLKETSYFNGEGIEIKGYMHVSSSYPNIIKRIQLFLEKNPNFFARLKLRYQDSGPCGYSLDGKRLSASYKDEVICFDAAQLASKEYNRYEATLKITALYIHELAHAAGYTNSEADENLLAGFQISIEKHLDNWNFSQPEDGVIDSTIDMNITPTRDIIKQLLKGTAAKKTSLLWVCLKMQTLTDRLTDNRQASHGYSLLTSEEGYISDLITWEFVLLQSLNCDGAHDEDFSNKYVKSMHSSRTKNISLHAALLKNKQIAFCDEEYGPRVCQTAKSTLIPVKKLSLEEFKRESSRLVLKIKSFIDKHKLFIAPDYSN